MSLYHILFGTDETKYATLCKWAGLDMDCIQRFRDIWMYRDENETGKLLIVLWTRTGGGNREYYPDGNDYLSSRENYVGDHDAEFDTTFAEWYFLPLAEHEKDVQDKFMKDSTWVRPDFE